MNKKEVLKSLLETYTFPDKDFQPESILEIISKDEYNLHKELGLNSTTYSRRMLKVFGKQSGLKLHTWLLQQVELKYCVKCREVKELEEFPKNKNKQNGIYTYCKKCHSLENENDYLKHSGGYKQRSREYKLKVKERTPSWSNLEKIREIYNICPKGYHVDHIIPLNGELVSGLHIPENLQYLLAEENLAKSNKFKIPE